MIYVYIMANACKGNIHVGYSADINKTVSFYSNLPTLSPDLKGRLVYLEGYPDKVQAFERFKEITTVPHESVIALVETINPDFVEMVPGKNVQI